MNKRIISIDDLIEEDYFTDPRHNEWRNQDIEDFNQTKLLDISDMYFDLCILDSTEFGGFAEFEKIKDKCRYLVLDDSNVLKHEKTREYCINNYEILADYPNDRNGWCVFKLC